jgi:transposase-like protein
VPAKITIDKSGANKAAIKAYSPENNTEIEIRQAKYLNNIVEQDHRSIRRIVRPMLGFKAFHSASVTLSGIEFIRMIRKGQLKNQNDLRQTPAEIFYSLAA